jgi:hypothetical protein
MANHNEGRGKQVNYDKHIDTAVAYLHGRIEAQLEAFAVSIGTSAADLTSRVATLLLAQGAGTAERVPKLRGASTSGDTRLAKVALVDRAHRPTQDAKRPGTYSSKVRSTNVKGYWARMTPKQRKAEGRRRWRLGMKRREERQGARGEGNVAA